MDSSEASKLVAARISQLELDAAGEKDQEAEIGASSFLLSPLRFKPCHEDLAQDAMETLAEKL